MRALATSLLLAAVGTVCGYGQGVDLEKKYPAKLDRSEPPRAYDWTCDAGDAWSLSSFSYALGDQLDVRLGPSTVVFGKHDTSVLWAVVLPDKPGRLKSSKAGDGDGVAHIWLRFHPSRVGELFPPSSVRGPGGAERLWQGKRMCHWKTRGSWQAGGRPVVPSREAITLDLDTTDHRRRFFAIDTTTGQVTYYSDFESRALPQTERIKLDTALEVFDEVWNAFDKEYAMFTIKPEVDWKALQERYRPQAAKAKTGYQVAAIVAEMLAHLQDLHAWVSLGEESVPGYNRPRPLNASWNAVFKIIPRLTLTQRTLARAKTADGIGYINVLNLGNRGLPKMFDGALETLSDTWALVIDLRFNGGGDETLAQKISGRFLGESRVYSLSQYRDGPGHADLGPRLERVCEPRGPWRYESPVVVLIGQKTMSSAESFALMLAQAPQVTTLGDRTAGSSANPRTLTLPAGIVVNLPRWLDLDPDGNPIDKVGVAPGVRVEARPETFSVTSDPVLEAALAWLRRQPEDSHKPGKRN